MTQLNDAYDQIGNLSGNLDGRGINVKTTFGAKGDGTTDDTTVFLSALTADGDIIIPSGAFRITNTITVPSGTDKKVIGTVGTTILVDFTTSKKLFDLSRNISFENITFDFNNGLVSTALYFRESLGKIRLKNCKFINVRDTDSTTSTILVYVSNYGNTVDIDGLEFNNCYKKGNGVIGDGGGNITGIFLTDNITSAPVNGFIRNIRIIEMHNVDAVGSIIFEDTSGIYPSSSYTGNDGFLSIENVYGYNYGKRLIKTDGSNISMKSIYAYSNTNDALSAIGMNNTGLTKQKYSISDVQIYGAMNYGISVSGKNTTIDDVIIDIQKPSLTGNNANAFGIGILYDLVTINNANITAERPILISRTDDVVSDIKISNSLLTVPSWGTNNIDVASGSCGFKNFTIENVTAVNNSTSGGTNSLISTSILTGVSNKQKGKGLNIINCAVYGASLNNYGLYLNNLDGVNITNYEYSNDGVTKAYRGIYASACKNMRITNINCLAYVQSAIQAVDCSNIRVFGLITPESDFSLNVSTSTNVNFKDVDKTKMSLNDSTTLLSSHTEVSTSSGTTTNRPTIANVGDSYFDATLNKVIYCKTAAVNEKDTLTISAGATSSGNITITLNGVAVTVAVTAGDTSGTIGDKIRGATFKQWIAGGLTGSATVTFTKTTGGINTTPTFTDTGTTGTAATFAVTTAGTNPVWVDSNNVNPDSVGTNVAVGSGATTLVVTFATAEANTIYTVSVSPAWNTTYWITGKTTTGFTINFGTAPASASTLDWTIRR